jgi:hypothetical protein
VVACLQTRTAAVDAYSGVVACLQTRTAGPQGRPCACVQRRQADARRDGREIAKSEV